MEPLFETKVKINLDDCYALIKFWTRKSTAFSRVMAVLSALMLPVCFHIKSYKEAAFFVFMAVFFIVADPIIIKKRAEKTYNSNKQFYDAEQTIRFYENKLTRESELSKIELDYSELGKIFEVKTHFFIMQSKTTAICIRKENCSGDLCGFIRKVGKDNGTYVCCDK